MYLKEAGKADGASRKDEKEDLRSGEKGSEAGREEDRVGILHIGQQGAHIFWGPRTQSLLLDCK